MQEIIVLNQHLDLIFLDIPLLFESNLEYLCDAVIVVYLKEDEEIKRLMKRDNIVNMDTRTVLSCIPYYNHALSQDELIIIRVLMNYINKLKHY